MRPVIIDTDIGTDIDDALALVYAVKSRYDIKLVTTVHGNTVQRAKIAKKLLNMLEFKVEVASGEGIPIKQKHIYWYGKEGEGFVTKRDKLDISQNGVDSIIRTIENNRNNIDIVCIGPLTNIAKAFEIKPGLEKEVNTLYIMGNAILTPDNFYLNYRAHNFKVDPEAADLVFSKDVRKVLVTTEVAKRSHITQEELNSFKFKGEVGKYLSSAGATWLKRIEYKEAFLYDPLTMALLEDESIIKARIYKNVHIAYDLNKDFRKKFKERMEIK